MSFPNALEGVAGDEKVVGTDRLHELGHEMAFGDGRTFRYARVGGTALVPGKLYQGVGEEANTSLGSATIAPAGTNSAGDREVTLTIAGTALVADVFKDGFLNVASSIGTDVGQMYKIATNNSCAIGATCTITLAGNDKLVATWNGSTKVGLVKSPFDEVILTTADTVFASAIAGVSCASAAASIYVWLQKTGMATVFTDATTLVEGQPVICSTTVAGAVGSVATTAVTVVGKSKWQIGQVIAGTSSVAASAEYGHINLDLPD